MKLIERRKLELKYQGIAKIKTWRNIMVQWNVVAVEIFSDAT